MLPHSLCQYLVHIVASTDPFGQEVSYYIFKFIEATWGNCTYLSVLSSLQRLQHRRDLEGNSYVGVLP